MKVTETAPAITVTSEITIATIGRLMKNLAILRGSRVGVSAYRRVGVSRFAKRDHFRRELLVHRLLNLLGFVAFKMGRLRGGRKEHPAPFLRFCRSGPLAG